MSKPKLYYVFKVEITNYTEEDVFTYEKEAPLGSTIGLKLACDEAMVKFLEKYPQYNNERQKKYLKTKMKILKKEK